MTNFTSHHSIHDIPAADWQRLYNQLQPAGYPFLDRRFLLALEDSGCIGSHAQHSSGWQVNYLTDDNISFIVPTFIKYHSYGEYVFDWSWAEAYERYDLNYYPKLLWAIPFTPATGPRLLGHIDQLPQAIAAVEYFTHQQALSGWHLNFTDEETTQTTATMTDAALRHGCQFHWFNENYTGFEHYLQHFVSRKRKSVRKERQRVAAQGISITQKTGGKISTEDIHFFYQCYQDTYHRRRSTPYLNEAFFQQLRTTMSEKILLVIASKDERPIAAALYLFDTETLYGRYWGALDDIDALHFEVCYYQGIEFCIENNLKRFDPGTQGEHKISRGFRPVTTTSFHALQHPQFQQAVKQFVDEEREHMRHYHAEAESLTPYHRTQSGNEGPESE